MKLQHIFSLVLFLLPFSMSAQVAPDSIQYHKGGILYQEMKLKKPRDIGSVLLENKDPDVSLYFRKYKTNFGVTQVFSVVGGAAVGYSLGTAIGGGKLNAALLGAGAGTIIIGILFNAAANKNLKLAVKAYNKPPVAYLRPASAETNPDWLRSK